MTSRISARPEAAVMPSPPKESAPLTTWEGIQAMHTCHPSSTSLATVRTSSFGSKGPVRTLVPERLPLRFHMNLNQHLFLRNEFEPFFEPLPAMDGFATSTLTKPMPTQTPVSMPAEGDVLPDLPAWLLGGLAGIAAFVIVVAGVLMLMQFPPAGRTLGVASWMGKWVGRWMKGRRKRGGYERVVEDEYEFDGLRNYGEDLGVGQVDVEVRRTGISASTGMLKKRRPRHLRVNTAGEYHGLGIAVPGDECVAKTPKQRQSFDEEALRQPKPESQVAGNNTHLTAPLPSTRAFSPLHRRRITKPPLPAREKVRDMESGQLPPHPISAPSPDIFDITSPLHDALRSPRHETTPRSGLLTRINEGVSYTANKLSKAFHEQVNGPEDGLLLPMRETEREKPLVAGVFVD